MEDKTLNVACVPGARVDTHRDESGRVIGRTVVGAGC